MMDTNTDQIVSNDVEDDDDDVLVDNNTTTTTATTTSIVVDDDDDEQVRALAARLAPQVEQLETLLASPTKELGSFSSSSGDKKVEDDDDDDEMDTEWSRLAASEQMLRQELEFAQDVSSMFRSSRQEHTIIIGMSPMTRDGTTEQQDVTTPEITTTTTTDVNNNNSSILTPSSTAMSRLTIDEPSLLKMEHTNQHPLTGDGQQYRRVVPSIPEGDYYGDLPSMMTTPKHPRTTAIPKSYTLSDHAKYLGIQVEPRGGWYSCPISFPMDDDDNIINKDCFAREYILPVPFADLKRFHVGLAEPPPIPQQQQQDTSEEQQPSLLLDDASPSRDHDADATTLPVRTVAIRIRPDVLCGAVMDAIHHALDNLGNAQVTKRQGGHLRGIVGGARVISENQQQEGNDYDGETHPQSSLLSHNDAHATTLPPFLVDTQLCTYKGSRTEQQSCALTLLLRTYRISAQHEDASMMAGEAAEIDVSRLAPLDVDYDDGMDGCYSAPPQLRFKEASALVQRMESDGANTNIHSIVMDHAATPVTAAASESLVSRWSPLKLFGSSPSSSSAAGIQRQDVFTDPIAMREAVSTHLTQHYRPCPSVLAGGLTLPALSDDDWPIVQSSWRLIQSCWNELETRDLAYATLANTNFGAFPSLPTLDVHYCSQIRRLCRENMIVSLLKSASELEEYARQEEYSCANLIQILRTTFDGYQMEPPALPRPVPLTAYPLDFTPPQASCPPWGFKVMEALNQVAAMTSDANKQLLAAQDDDASSPPPQVKKSSFEMAEDAVRLVFDAFTKQDDEEQAARLGRKNVQVMDRLAKMQAHKRASIHAISDSYGRYPRATKAADEFHSMAMPETALEDVTSEQAPQHQVPLFKCSILVGHATGTCYVTATQILFVTQRIPIVGGNTYTLFNISEVEFNVMETSSPSLLNPLPLPGGISVVRNEQQVYTFRPSLGAQRFKSFVDIVREVAMETPEKNLKFSDRGGLLYMYDGDEHHDGQHGSGQQRPVLPEEGRDEGLSSLVQSLP